MATVDWIFLVLLGASFLLGAWRGLVYEVLSVMSWIAAFILAQWLAPDAAAWLPVERAPEAGRYAIGFIVVFIAVVFAGGLLAWLTKKLVQAVGLRPVDRTLGAVFGLIRGAVLLLAVAVVINMSPARRAVWWTESKGAEAAMAALKNLKPMLPERFAQHLPG
jgi:membrane protein required for colicin V production